MLAVAATDADAATLRSLMFHILARSAATRLLMLPFLHAA